MIDYNEFKSEYLTERIVKKKIEVLNKIDTCLLENKFDAEINKKIICNLTDLENLKNLWACKYVNKENNEIIYNTPGSRRQLQVGADLDILMKNNLLEGLYNSGITEDIFIIITTDTIKNISIILDGLHRTTTLYSMYLYKRELINELLFSRRFKIELTEIKSKIAPRLFPYDFQM